MSWRQCVPVCEDQVAAPLPKSELSGVQSIWKLDISCGGSFYNTDQSFFFAGGTGI